MQDIPTASDLMPLMGFTSQDLRANEAGELGATQRQRLARLRQRAIGIGGAVFCVFVLIATVFLYLGQANDSGILTALGILLTLLNAVALGMFARHWMRLNADLNDNRVQAVRGELERIVKPSGQLSNYILRLEGNDFEVTKEVFKLFRHEVTYTFYCAPRSGVLLAARPDAG